jgi:hypothetical protein
MTRKGVKGVLESLAKIGYSELKNQEPSSFLDLPNLLSLRSPLPRSGGINPFTKEPTIFKAKPARKIVRARPVKAARRGGASKPFSFY